MLSISYSEMAYALEKSLVKIDAAIMKVLEMIPPELYADIAKKGVYLAGGGALLKGLDRRCMKKPTFRSMWLTTRCGRWRAVRASR